MKCLVAKLNNNYNRLCKIKAERVTVARKIALTKLERLARRSQLPWILLEEPGIGIGRAGINSKTFRRILSLAVKVFENEGPARQWLNKPLLGLGRRKPFKMIQTDVGARKVEALLLPIEHGVYS